MALFGTPSRISSRAHNINYFLKDHDAVAEGYPPIENPFELQESLADPPPEIAAFVDYPDAQIFFNSQEPYNSGTELGLTSDNTMDLEDIELYHATVDAETNCLLEDLGSAEGSDESLLLQGHIQAANLRCLCFLCTYQREAFDVIASQRDCTKPDEINRFKSVIQTTVACIIKKCWQGIMHRDCAACVIHAPGQRHHDCLKWERNEIHQKIHKACNRLCLGPILNVAMIAGHKMKATVLVYENLNFLFELVRDFNNSRNPGQLLNILLNSVADSEKEIVEGLICDRDYRSFFKNTKFCKN